MTCSQLSSTSSSSCSPIISASRFGSGRSRAEAIAAGTPAGSPTGASSTRHPPERRPSATARPTSRASRVLPTPPGPTRVTKRWSANSVLRSRSSASRPTSGVSASGMPGCEPGAGGGERCEVPAWRRQRRVVGEDRRLQPAQLGSRFEAELLAQELTALLEDPERVGLPPGCGRARASAARGTPRAADGWRRAPRAGRSLAGDGPAGARGRAAPRATARRDSDNRVIAPDGEVLVGEVGERIAPPEGVGLGEQRRRLGRAHRRRPAPGPRRRAARTARRRWPPVAARGRTRRRA